MKKYLAILLTIAMASCTNEPTGDGDTGGGGVGPAVKRLVSMAAQFTGDPLVTDFGKSLGDWTGAYGTRIPVIYTLANGTVLAGGDARLLGTADAPNDIDSFIRISKDNGGTWSKPIFQHYNDDNDNTKDPIKRVSSSYIDSTLGQAADGTVVSMVNGFRSGGGIQGGISNPEASPFIDIKGKRYLLLINKADSPDPMSASAVDQINKFTNVVLLGEVTLGGKDSLTPTDVKLAYDNKTTKRSLIRGVTLKSDGTGAVLGSPVNVAGSSKWEIDEYWMLYKDGVQVEVKQLNNNAVSVKASVNYGGETQFRTINNGYAFVAYSKDNGENWEQSKDVSWHFRSSAGEGVVGPFRGQSSGDYLGKGRNARDHYIVSPGRLHTMTVGPNKGRMFSVLYSFPAPERALAVYSDDHGITWHRGGLMNTLPAGSKSSETQIVEAPDGTPLAFARSGGGINLYQSTDGGDTWDNGISTGLPDGAPQGTMITPVNLRHTKGFNGQELIAISYPDNPTQRQNGVVRIVELKKVDNKWKVLFNTDHGTDIVNMTTRIGKDKDHAATYRFGYSAITELANGDIGLINDAFDSKQLEYYNIGLNRK